MSSKNIKYQTDGIEAFYKNHRVSWKDFYLSEKTMLEKLNLNMHTSVLDIGCGCGGLGNALRERYNIKEYMGVDINSQAIRTAKTLFPQFDFLEADILSSDLSSSLENKFDVVVSFSCVDWNVEFDKMIKSAMQFVKPGGVFLSSFRLSNESGNYSQDLSYQYINFQGVQEGEKAPYIVFNPKKLFKQLLLFKPIEIQGVGYWGAPSKTAVTPYKKVCFSVLAITKGPSDDCLINLNLPEDLVY